MGCITCDVLYCSCVMSQDNRQIQTVPDPVFSLSNDNGRKKGSRLGTQGYLMWWTNYVT